MMHGEEYLLIRDPHGFASDAAVPRTLAPLLALFDGLRTPAQIIAAYEALGGETLPEWFIAKVVADLDRGLLLESPRFASERQATLHAFTANPRRPAAHAGQSYPDDPQQLRAQLDGYFAWARSFDASRRGARLHDPTTLRGIVVPHIDFTRGGPVEALAYQQLTNETFDVFVVLGIAHCGVHYPFCGAVKDYETPLGTAHVDSEFMGALQERVGERMVAEQFAHKNEHSIEFVAVFLQYLQTLKNARIVPILCGGFHDSVRRGTEPQNEPDISQFCKALREVVAQWEARGARVGFIASVDLAHVGSRFGDDEVLTPSRLKAIEHADHEFLKYMESGDAQLLHRHIARDGNARNVDAHPALYTLLTAFPELRAQLLHYDQAFDAAANSVVSFASMAVYE
jgi:hypothetical protein